MDMHACLCLYILNVLISHFRSASIMKPDYILTFIFSRSFLAGRCNLISPTNIKGLNDFTTYFTLPPLIFLNLVTINFRHVNWLFILSILMGKSIVFILVAMVTASVHRPTNLSYAGIYGIFSTQGNDFGLAYPIGQFNFFSSLLPDFLLTFIYFMLCFLER